MADGQFLALAQASAARLERLMRAGQAPPVEALLDCEWRGANTGWQARALGIQKFIKGFFKAADRVEGYNIPVVQNGLAAPWQPLPSAAQPRRYAFFHVRAVDPSARDNLYPQALLLDYGASTRNAESPRIARRIRDYLVQPDPANPDLLLGKAYLALGPVRVPSNYFAIERLRATDWRPEASQRDASR